MTYVIEWGYTKTDNLFVPLFEGESGESNSVDSAIKFESKLAAQQYIDHHYDTDNATVLSIDEATVFQNKIMSMNT